MSATYWQALKIATPDQQPQTSSLQPNLFPYSQNYTSFAHQMYSLPHYMLTSFQGGHTKGVWAFFIIFYFVHAFVYTKIHVCALVFSVDLPLPECNFNQSSSNIILLTHVFY